MRFRLTKNERNWVLYDVGNSAFVLLVSTIMPIYFNYLAGNAGLSSADYMAYWGYAASIVTIIVAVLGPVMGTLADTKDFKKPVFTISMLAGAAGCICLGLARQWVMFIIIYIIAKTGFSCSLIFYDSMLVDVTDEKRMDYVSSQGFAWGYIGSCIPFVGCLLLVLGSSKIGISMELAMGIAFVIVAVWWLGMSLPHIKKYEQKNYVERKPHAIRESFKRLYGTCKNIKKEKHIFLFLLAFFFYIDGVYTIIDMATAYGSALGLDSTGLLLALLVTQIVAFPCAIIFGRLSYKVSTDKLILVCIVAYLGIAVFAIFLRSQLQFWILAILVGMFQGGIQALSRSYFTKIIPEEKNGEYFGLMDICGKGASFLGTTVVSIVSQLTGDINKGVGMIAVLFCIGIVVFLQAVSAAKNYNEEKAGTGMTIDTDSVNVVKSVVVSENV
ncbi:MAG TPA: MFS transporter [Eubacterium sp.]|nr:MFS transporter [Eubacterium sp.]